MGELRYREAAGLLTDLLIDVRELRGSAVDAYLPVTYGYLGECYFQASQADRAVAPTAQALERASRCEDLEGVAAYLGNLYEIHRYLGQTSDAAQFAQRLAEVLARQGKAEEAERYARQAERVRAGEPLNRVVVDVDGQRFELAEVLRGQAGNVRFFFERNRLTLRPCADRTQEGERSAGAGRFDEALALFREAAQADRFDPQSHYQAGLTLLYLQRYNEAVREYEATEERAPGWFHCRSDLWLARQMVLGQVDHETFVAWHALQDGPLQPETKVRLAERALARAPDLALLHHLHGRSLRERGLAVQAEAALRRGLALAEEPDVRTRLLVDLGTLVRPDEKRRLLEEALQINGNLVAAATAAVVLAFE
jgi:tetratricopeptide (TPR) repeat protein